MAPQTLPLHFPQLCIFHSPTHFLSPSFPFDFIQAFSTWQTKADIRFGSCSKLCRLPIMLRIKFELLRVTLYPLRPDLLPTQYPSSLSSGMLAWLSPHEVSREDSHSSV